MDRPTRAQEAQRLSRQRLLEQVLTRSERSALKRWRKEAGPEGWRMYAAKRILKRLARSVFWFGTLTYGDRLVVARTHERIARMFELALALSAFVDLAPEDLERCALESLSRSQPTEAQMRARHRGYMHSPAARRFVGELVQAITVAHTALYQAYDGFRFRDTDLHEPVRSILIALRGIAFYADYRREQLHEEVAKLVRDHWGIRAPSPPAPSAASS
ncbi:MAG TPA: hypothetical protein VHO23_00480 [Candidatus Paceibacterota bacterium]|nr:hypothetical protein [Candidatus Paceibacterota bacterium]